MALQKTYTKFDIDFNAYHKVQQLNVSKEFIHIHVQILHKINGEALSSKTYQMDYDPTGTEPLTQAYTYLKTLPEFAGAIDV